MKKLLLLLMTIFTILSLTACQKDQLVVYTEAGFAPFEYVKDDKISGVDIEIMEEVGRRLNKEVVFKNVSFQTVLDVVHAGKLGKVGAAGISITEERKKQVDFSQVYYQANLYVIFDKAKTPKNQVMTDEGTGVYWEDLKTNKGIGVQQMTTADLFLTDFVAEGALLAGTKKTTYDSLNVATAAIGSHIDYVVVDELPAKKLVENNADLACLPLYEHGEGEDILSHDEYAICVTPGETKLLETINQVLNDYLVEDEAGLTTIDKLVESHLGFKEAAPKKTNLFQDIWTILSTAKFRSYLFQGFINTIIITLLAALIGLVLGFVIAMVKIFAIDNKYLKIPNFICNLYTTIIRGTPIALQLFVMVFAILAFPGFQNAAIILTFGLNSGAYVSESVRAGIMSVDKGQLEAGRALGLSNYKTMIKIILPQAIKNVIPAIGNELIALIKETAIISMVGSTIGTLTFDLNQATQTINKSIANYLAPAILSGLLYLAIVYLITLVIKFFEKRFSLSDKR